MREILFKAKRIDNGEWVYGNYAFTDTNGEQHFIFQNKAFEYEVNPDTICQYTGLTDKNGYKIWENDIVRKIDSNALGWYRERICNVYFDSVGYWGIMTTLGDGYWMGEFDEEQLEVIGNIFDNKELLQEAGETDETN